MIPCKRLVFICVCICVIQLGNVALADYGQIPKAGLLHVKLGFDFLSTSENFASDGERENITFQNQTVDFSSNGFWLEPEYGIGEQVAAQFRLRGWSGNLNPISGGNTVASGSGLADIDLALKWSIMAEPVSTLEFSLRLPPYSRAASSADLVAGDGSVDFGVHYHLSISANLFRFYLSPGVITRSGGYPAQVRLGLAAETRLRAVYLRVFTDTRLSLGYAQLGDSSESQHDAVGSGGSFARLSGGSTGLDVGLKTGVEMASGVFGEGYASHSVLGSRYPNALVFGINLHCVLDTNIKDARTKAYEVPIDKPSEPTP